VSAETYFVHGEVSSVL